MYVPPDVLEVLKCSSCELYLSQSPVYLEHDGAAACGRCYTPKRPAARNTLYEATARLLNLKFPCKNRQFGCLETVPYVEEHEVFEHRDVCEHRQYVCLVLGSARCDWRGPRATMLAHCHDQHPDSVLEECSFCQVELTMFAYHNRDGWRCESCAPYREACENENAGCTHTDILHKNFKHASYFCQHSTDCLICYESVFEGLSAHYSSVHITHRAGSTWRATQTDEWCLLSSVAGTVVCWYLLCSSLFILKVYTPVSSERLSEFRCEVRLTDPVTGHAHTFTPDIDYDDEDDWYMDVNNEEFPSLNNEMDICMEIRKAESYPWSGCGDVCVEEETCGC